MVKKIGSTNKCILYCTLKYQFMMMLWIFSLKIQIRYMVSLLSSVKESCEYMIFHKELRSVRIIFMSRFKMPTNGFGKKLRKFTLPWIVVSVWYTLQGKEKLLNANCYLYSFLYCNLLLYILFNKLKRENLIEGVFIIGYINSLDGYNVLFLYNRENTTWQVESRIRQVRKTMLLSKIY